MMNHPEIITGEQIKQAMDFTNIGDVERKLTQQKIRYFYGRKGVIWTTISLINAAGGLSSNDESSQTQNSAKIF